MFQITLTFGKLIKNQTGNPITEIGSRNSISNAYRKIDITSASVSTVAVAGAVLPNGLPEKF